MASELPETIGPYRILGALGEGGMGVVYRGEHVRTGRSVALKTVRLPRAGQLQSLRREIHALARVHHPGIVRIVDEGIWDGLPWYAMELLEGTTLRQYALELAALAPADEEAPTFGPDRGEPRTAETELGSDASTASVRLTRPTLPDSPSGAAATPPTATAAPAAAGLASGPPPAARARPPASTHAPLPPAAGGALLEVLRLVRWLCNPLGFLHGEGLVHRDLKPDNILVRNEERGMRIEERQSAALNPQSSFLVPVLVDFGLTTRFSGEVSREVLEVGGSVVGTVSYMAPEQWLGEFVDARADLYSLGCILYELVTGRRPFGGSTSTEVGFAHLQARPERPSRLVEGVAPELDALILQLLAKRPQDRLGHADDVAAVLGSLLGEDERIWPGAPEPQAYLYRPRLAGRERELGELEQDLVRLADGRGGVVLVGGESGVGKTRLAMELARAARGRGFRVLIGEGLPLSASSERRAASGEPVAGSPLVGGPPLHPLRAPLQSIADRCREGGPLEAERIFGRRARVLAAYEPALAELPCPLRREGERGELEPDSGSPLPAAAARLRLFLYLAEALEAFAGSAGEPGLESGTSSRRRSGAALRGGPSRPLVLVLDDLQWADELTLGFLRFFGRRAAARPGLPVLIAGTYRTEEAGEGLRGLLEEPGVRHLRLGRLDERAIGRLAGDMLALQRPPPGLVRFLAQHSEGNPFFIAEYLRTAVAEGLLFRDSTGRWQAREGVPQTGLASPAPGSRLPAPDYDRLPVPGSLQELVARRLARRSAGARHLVEAAAVLGREFDEVLLVMTAHLGGAAMMEAIDELIGREILEEVGVGRLRFVQDPFRQVAYERLAPEARRELHRAAAEAIETQPDPERDRPLAARGHHWEQAGRPASARRCYRTEARRAAARHAHREAERLYRAYLALVEDEGAESLQARLELGRDVLEVQGRYAEALAEHEHVLELARRLGDRATEAAALSRAGTVCWTLGRLEAARGAWEQVLLLAAETGDRRVEGKALADLAVLHHTQGRLEEARSLYELALPIQRESRDLRGESITLGNLAIVHENLGRPEQSRELHLEALAIARAIGDRKLEAVRLSNLAMLDQERGRLERARVHFELALELVRDVGDRRQEGMILGHLAALLLGEGHAERARELFEQTRAIQAEVGDRRSYAVFTGELANLERRAGRLDEAERLLDEAEPIHRELDDALYTAWTLCARGHLALARGKPARALQQQARALIEEARAGERSEFGKALARLERALAAHEAGEPLVHGEHPADLPVDSGEAVRGVD